MKKKINRGVLLTLAVLLGVFCVAYGYVGKMSKEKESACAVVTAALKEYLNARTIPFEMRQTINEGTNVSSGEFDIVVSEKRRVYYNYLQSVMYAPDSKSTELQIDEMVRSAEINLNRQYSKKTPIDGYVLEELHNSKIGFLKDDFKINADFTEISVTVEHKVRYNNQSTSTEKTYNLVKVNGEWKLNTVLNLYGVS